ncbi:MAG: serine/threonine protein phosphatase [Ruminococcaceae bacterium]|nr:serine/threonine protein phosphatase [Oscillospiraceae bacterium]
MSLYVIGDLHLSFGCDKPMDVFGGRWENYTDKLLEGFSTVGSDDTTVICGDLSWGMSLEGAKEDFLFIHRLPGKKIILKGNHDYWWTTASQAYRFFAENGIDSIEILNNNCFAYENYAICGTRGWFYEESKSEEHDKKILARELMRLETSLKAAQDREKLVFLHYPPKLVNYERTELLDLMEAYGVKNCWYGHLHSGGRALAFEGVARGIRFHLISADHVQFIPQKIF